MSEKIKAPIIFETKYNQDTATKLNQEIDQKYADNQKAQSLLTEYPTVYVINDSTEKKRHKYTVYVGETNDIQRRTIQHIESDPKSRSDFSDLKDSSNVDMYVIGHEHFNKSMTLDVENRLMQYLSSVPAVSKLNNRRFNDQNKYYNSKEFDIIFKYIWKGLNKKNKELFPAQKLLEDSALFKASPFNKLTSEQLKAKSLIIEKINQALIESKSDREKDGKLILVEGDAGSGKTVLMSNIFYDLVHENHLMNENRKEDDQQSNKRLSVAMLVNQNEQLKVYEEISKKLFDKEDNVEVEKPVTFIKNTYPDEKVDIALVDEAHLLLTQNNQSYSNSKNQKGPKLGSNMLLDIMKRAKVVRAVFDPKQILSTASVWDGDAFKILEDKTGKENIVRLHNQMRIDASSETVKWIRNLIDYGKIGKIPEDEKYSIKIFSDPAKMEQAISNKNEDQENGISRMVATFDWPYSGGKTLPPSDQKYWLVSEGDWQMPWNYEINARDKYEKNHRAGRVVKYNQQSWAEKDYTINEIGSTYTVQGFDLNFVGVELGPSVKYRDGRIIHDPSESENSKATQKRDSSKSYAQELLKNEFNVLLTRGVHGLYIHAVDPALQKALEDAAK